MMNDDTPQRRKGKEEEEKVWKNQPTSQLA